jgi:5-methylcytosine-specific restriction endonuclease McrBC regulatory subunit McrC
MKTDISIAFPDRRLIIDTKFYGKGGLNGGSSDARKFHSGHLYQIHAYITQLARMATPNAPLDLAASGMLLLCAPGAR